MQCPQARPSEQWLEEVWLSVSDVQESSTRLQYPSDLLLSAIPLERILSGVDLIDICSDVLLDALFSIPQRPMQHGVQCALGRSVRGAVSRNHPHLINSSLNSRVCEVHAPYIHDSLLEIYSLATFSHTLDGFAREVYTDLTRTARTIQVGCQSLCRLSLDPLANLSRCT